MRGDYTKYEGGRMKDEEKQKHRALIERAPAGVLIL
jgi:hypothetical protein